MRTSQCPVLAGGCSTVQAVCRSDSVCCATVAVAGCGSIAAAAGNLSARPSSTCCSIACCQHDTGQYAAAMALSQHVMVINAAGTGMTECGINRVE